MMITLRLNQQPPCLAVHELSAIRCLLESSLVGNESMTAETLDHIYSANLHVIAAIAILSGANERGVN